MRRLRLIADVIAAVNVEDCDNRAARRAWFGEKMGAMDPKVFPLMLSGFAGPENGPAEAVRRAHPRHDPLRLTGGVVTRRPRGRRARNRIRTAVRRTPARSRRGRGSSARSRRRRP